MKPPVITFLKRLFILAYLVFIYFYVIIVINPALHYHTQQASFITTSDFFFKHLSAPGMISTYISNFLMQFFFYNWTGALIIILLGFSFMLILYHILQNFLNTGSGYFWMFLPLIFLVALLANYYFPFEIVIQIIFAYLAVWIFTILLKKKLNPFLIYPVIAIPLYYIAGSVSFLIASASIFIIILYTKDLKNSILFFLMVTLTAIIIPFIAYKFLFNITIKSAYFSLIPDRPVILKYQPDKILYLFYFYLPALILILSIISYFTQKIKQKNSDAQQEDSESIIDTSKIQNTEINYSETLPWSSKIWIAAPLFLIILISITLVSFQSTYDKHQKNIALADYYNDNEKWDKVIDVALSNHGYDIYLNYYYNRAIDHAGHFFDMYFNYPQLSGKAGIDPDSVKSGSITLISSDFYYDLGYITQAHHWAHEAQTAMPYSPRILKRLVMTNLIFGNYIASGNLLSIMDKMFFCKNFVNKYRPYIKDTSLVASDKEIAEKRSFMPYSKVISAMVADRFIDLLEKNDQNKSAIEHLVMYCLLTHNLGNFMLYLPELMKFYKSKPEIIDEAILVYLANKKKKDINDYNINLNAQALYADYVDVFYKYGRDKAAAKPILFNKFGNSYLYYMMYYSPLVTGAKVKTK